MTQTLSAKPPKLGPLTLGRPRPSGANSTARFRPTPPRADVLPPVWRAKEAARVARIRAFAGCAAAIVVVAGTYGFGVVHGRQVDASTATALDRQRELSRELAVYAPVTNLAVQSEQLTTTVQQQTSTDVDYSKVMGRFLQAVSGTMQVTSMRISTGPNTVCASSDPFVDRPTAGCVTFAGTAIGQGGAAATVAALSHDDWFVDAFIPNVGTNDAGATTVSGSVALSVDTYANPQTGQQNGSTSK